MSNKLSQELQERGFIKQFSGDSLEEIVDGEKRTFYLGVDPTADSIHVGNLTVYMLMRHLADAGHKIILLVGGGTGLLGDPKETEERELSDAGKIAERAEKLKKQVSNLLDTDVKVVNNADWLKNLGLIDFMRDIGKHFTINQMIKKEIIAKRLADKNPISYTEFAYAPMQGYDFLHLFKNNNCEVQVGGSDQWGNIISGVELIHKKEKATAYALTAPLIIDKTTGRKFGKSEGNAVWLDPEMTTPYQFYQFWLNVDDADVIERLKIFTLLSLNEIVELEKEVKNNPKARNAQKTLAYEVAKFVHGEEASKNVKGVSEILFGNRNINEITSEEAEILKTEAPKTKVRVGADIINVLLSTHLSNSKSETRKLIEAGGISINNIQIESENHVLTDNDFVNDIALLRKGKKNLVVLLRS